MLTLGFLYVSLFVFAVIDIKYKMIPNYLMFPVLAIALVYRITDDVSIHVVGILILTYTVVNLLVISGLIGGADAKYLLIICLFLDSISLSVVFVLSYYLSWVFIMICNKTSKKDISKLPFTPFIFISLLIFTAYQFFSNGGFL